MKIPFQPQRHQASALLATMIVVVIAAMIIASYLAIALQDSSMVARSQVWNQCIPVGEAGVEEALTLIKNDGTTWGWTNSNLLAANGWSVLSNNITRLTRNIDNSNYYTVAINIGSGVPVIDSIGYVRFVSSGGQVTNLARKIEITLKHGQVAAQGLICSNPIALSGNVLIDSFDSSTNTGSTGGQYNSSKARDKVTVATASKAANAFYADGSCRVWGNISVGTGGGTVMNGVARAGDKVYVGASGGWPPGVNPANLSSGFLFQQPDNVMPSVPTAGMPVSLTNLPTAVVGGTNYFLSDGKNLGSYSNYRFTDLSPSGGGSKPFLVTGNTVNVVSGPFHVTSNGYMVIGTNANYALYVAGSFTLDGGPPTINGAANSIRICPGANVTIYAASDFTITASGRLSIDPTSQLTIYAGGNVNISGAGVVNTANATNLTLRGLPTCTSITIGASGNFIGTVNAPNAALSVSGASPFVGSAVVRSASLAGSGVFHYDESLAKTGTATGYSVATWQEKSM